jgi:hypothetical protein
MVFQAVTRHVTAAILIGMVFVVVLLIFLQLGATWPQATAPRKNAAEPRPAYTSIVLKLARPAGSLLVFLAVLVGIGAAFGHAIDMAGVAVFLLFVASISAKPAWKFWYDPPAKRETGRASCAVNSWQRVGATSPKEIRQLPEHRFSKRARRS